MDLEIWKCPIFDSLFLLSGDILKQNDRMRLISDQNWTFGWMRPFLHYQKYFPSSLMDRGISLNL